VNLSEVEVVNWLRREPAVILFTLNALLAVFVAWGDTPDVKTIGIVITAATGVATIITALLTRPMGVALFKGGATTVLIAFGSFGLHLSADRIGAIVAALSIVLGLLLRQNITPAVSVPHTIAK